MSTESFSFRPWVRSTCRTAMVWGIGVVGVLALVTWLLRGPSSAPLTRALGVLLAYGTLFWVSLLKIWWTAGRPAALLDDTTVGYQPLHLFRLKRLPLDRVLSCAPRPGTRSLRLVYEATPGRARELFLNLAVIDRQSAFLSALGDRLEAAGLRSVDGARAAWERPGWSE